MKIKKVAVLEEGTTGGRIAELLLQTGLYATILDISEDLVHKAIDKIKKELQKFYFGYRCQSHFGECISSMPFGLCNLWRA